jgi:hypothetical protein
MSIHAQNGLATGKWTTVSLHLLAGSGRFSYARALANE